MPSLPNHSVLSESLAIQSLFLPLTKTDQPDAGAQGVSPSEPDISCLTSRMSRGEEMAYQQFFDLYCNRLFRYLLVVAAGDEELARDALQLTMMRLVRYIKRFDSAEVFWSWLTVLARSALADEQRKHRRYLGLLDRFFRREQARLALVDNAADTTLLQSLENGLANLSLEERDLVERKYFLAQSVRAIASQLQITEKAIESRLVRIRKKLKNSILAQLKYEAQP